jgi:hypothetical protein
MTDMTIKPLEDQLDEWLAGGEDALFGPPEDMEQADRLAWALRKVDFRREEIDAVVRARMAALTVWAEQQYDQLDARRHHLESVLEGWARAQHADEPSRKTWKLPSGLTLKLAKRRARTMLAGPAKSEYLVAKIGALIPQAIKTERSVLVSAIADVAELGEPLDATAIGSEDIPEGYEVRRAVLRGDDDAYTTVPGVAMLVPKVGPEGQQFSIIRPKVGG